MVLANPEIANLPPWIIALVAAGGLAAALSTAAGLLLVISTSISRDLVKKTYYPDISESEELWIARISAIFAVLIAGYFGINPPGFAASSLFPAIILGIFSKRINREGAISGMAVGISLMLYYMMKFKLGWLGEIPPKSDWWFGISPEGFGSIAMMCNFLVSIVVSKFTNPPPKEVIEMIDRIRTP